MKELACLYGLHIGDSFGASLEFQGPSAKEEFQTDIVGGGVLHWNPGDPTDDTTMMIMLMESLLEDPELDIFELSGRFIDWWMSEPIDIGRTTYYSIQNMVDGKSPGHWGMTGEFDQGNGSLMRCAPLALFNCSRDIIFKQTAMTHNSPSCQLSDFILITAIRQAFNGEDKFIILDKAIATAEPDPKLQNYLKSILDMKWEELPTSGYVLHTLTAALWGLIHTENFRSAIIEVANRGDDSDTCAAVTGALCGAYYGLEGIPEAWVNIIKKGTEIESLFERWRQRL